MSPLSGTTLPRGVDDKPVSVDAEANTPLLYALRGNPQIKNPHLLQFVVDREMVAAHGAPVGWIKHERGVISGSWRLVLAQACFLEDGDAERKTSFGSNHFRSCPRRE